MGKKTDSRWGSHNSLTNRPDPVYWGKDCSSPMGKELAKLWTSDTVKPLAKHIATVLGTTEHAVNSAVKRYKLKQHPCWVNSQKNTEKVETSKIIIYGKNPSLPPLPSLQFDFDEKALIETQSELTTTSCSILQTKK